jgi:ATP-dependent RNA helicase DDX31/DBP7
MGHKGEAVLFLLPSERPYVELLTSKGVKLQEDNMEASLRWLPLPGGGGSGEADDGEGGRKRGRGPSKRDVENVPFALQRSIMLAVERDEEMRTLANDAFRSFVRAYATHAHDLKKIFHIRSLHLGHVAFSMGLKDTPGIIGQSGSAAERKKKKFEGSTSKARIEKKKLYSAAAKLGIANGQQQKKKGGEGVKGSDS